MIFFSFFAKNILCVLYTSLLLFTFYSQIYGTKILFLRLNLREVQNGLFKTKRKGKGKDMNKKIFTTLLAVAMLASSTAAFAAEETTTGETPVLISEAAEQTAKYTVTDAEVKDGAVEGIDLNTSVVLNTKGEACELKDGDTVKVFTSESTDAIIIVMDAEIAVDVDTYKVSDTFGAYVNSTEELALNVDENTDITDLNGEKVAHTELADNDLIVFYSMATMSIPAQTNPDKVVVLGKAVQAKADDAQDEVTDEIATPDFKSAYEMTEAEIDEAALETIKADGSIVLNMKGEIIEPVAGKALVYTSTDEEATVYVMVDEESEFLVDVDVYVKGDGVLVNAANTLAITLGDETETVKFDEDVVGSLKGRHLAVFYTTSTRSIPAQTTPVKVVVLDKIAEEAPEVDFTKVTALKAGETEIGAVSFDIDKNIFMIPVRAVAEALGYTVGWEGETKTVSVVKDDVNATMVIGTNSYAGTELEAAPEIIEDRTFVPSSFFEKVLGAVVSVVDTVLSIN